MNPVAKFWDWFDNLPIENKNYFIELVMSLLPGHGYDMVDHEKNRCEFDNSFRIDERKYHEAVGGIVVLRALISFIVKDWDKDEHWNRIEELCVSMLRDNPEGSRLAKTKLDSLPAEKIKSKDIYKSWSDLCQNVINDDALASWIDTKFIEDHDKRNG